MYLAHTISLIILVVILALLLRKERRVKKSIVHGLASKYWILREKRRYVRFDEKISIRYNPIEGTPNAKYSKSANISRKGLCLLTYEKLKAKDFLELELELHDSSKPIKLVGQVMWLKELSRSDEKERRLFYVGIKFAKINPDSEAILLTHLNTLKHPEI